MKYWFLKQGENPADPTPRLCLRYIELVRARSSVKFLPNVCHDLQRDAQDISYLQREGKEFLQKLEQGEFTQISSQVDLYDQVLSTFRFLSKEAKGGRSITTDVISGFVEVMYPIDGFTVTGLIGKDLSVTASSLADVLLLKVEGSSSGAVGLVFSLEDRTIGFATASILPGDGLIFDPEAFVFFAPSSNKGIVAIAFQDESSAFLNPGEGLKKKKSDVIK
jgi:hypothetical protein